VLQCCQGCRACECTNSLVAREVHEHAWPHVVAAEALSSLLAWCTCLREEGGWRGGAVSACGGRRWKRQLSTRAARNR